MRQIVHPRASRGFSIIELMVSLGIMSIVMMGAYQLFSEGMQLFRVNQASADAQAAVTKTMGVISTELTNAAPALTRNYGPPYVDGGAPPAVGGGVYPGLVFATPLDSEGKVHYDQANGQLYWQRYIAYYLIPDSTGGFNGKIYRAESDVAQEGGSIPGNRDVGVLGLYLDAHSTNDFSTAANTRRRMISEGISGLYVQPYDPEDDFGTGITAAKEAYDVYIEAGDRANAFRNSYFIRVRVRVSPGAR